MATGKAFTQMRMRGIDACRGAAAIMVVVLHSTGGIENYFGADPFEDRLSFFGRGVDFFFVLSGFIVTYVHWRDIGRPTRIPNYIFKRFIRIYPILWAIVIPYVALCFVTNSPFLPAGTEDRISAAVTSILVLPSRFRPVPTVVWTLKHEIFFYCLFLLALWKPRLSLLGLFVWAASTVAYGIRGDHSNFLAELCLSSYNLEFMLGVGVGILLRNVRVPFPLVFCIAGVMLFGYAAVMYRPERFDEPWIPNGTTLWQTIQFGVASGLIVVGVAQLDLNGKVVIPQAFSFIGEASYSIYLSHLLFISIGCRLLKRIDAILPLTPVVSVLALACISVLGGVLVHLLLEKPLIGLLARSKLALLGRDQLIQSSIDPFQAKGARQSANGPEQQVGVTNGNL